MKTRVFEASAFIALFICIISCISFGSDCEQIRQNVLRLHVIADSDSAQAQQVKLLVRDAILEEGADLFSDNESISGAEEKLEENLWLLEQTAQRTVNENGYDYSVKVELGESYFPVRQYGDITLPAGNYKAVKVILGEGQGKNWWCVMFPPLCLPAAGDSEVKLDDVLGERSADIVKSEGKYEVRFWLAEKWHEFVNSLE